MNGNMSQRFALSPEQRDLWRRCGDGRVEGLITVEGPLEAGDVTAALRAIVDDHEILRTRFERDAGFDWPLQVIDPPPASQLQWTITRLDDRHHELSLSTSCLNADAETFGLLMQEISERVAAAAAPAVAPLSEPGAAAIAGEVVQYADYSAWREAQAPIDSGVDTSTADVDTDLAEVACEIAVTRPDNVSEAVALAAWVALWCVHGGSEQMLVRRDGRSSPGLGRALGPFARWTPIAIALPEAASTNQAVESIERALDAASTRAVTGARATVGFWYREAPAVVRVGAQTWRLGDVGGLAAPCPLLLQLTRHAAGVRAELRYAPAQWSAADAARLLAQYAALVTAASAAAGAEMNRPWRTWAVGAPPSARLSVPEAPDVVETILAWAAAQPAQVAVRCGAATETYAGLCVAANGWAARVADLPPEARVGLALERSVDAVAAWLGLLGAGVTVVPLDANTPPERLAAQAKAAGLQAVIGAATLAAHWPAHAASLYSTPGVPMSDWPRPRHPAQRAYILLTSGSTGAPKGVAIPHAALAHYAASLITRLAPPSAATWELVSPLTVDLGYTSLLGALTTGGTLHWRTADEATSPVTVGGADYLKITPTHLTALLAATRPGDVAAVLPRRALLLGGEAPSWALRAGVARRAPALAVFNHYGPTETAVGVLLDEIPATPPTPAPPRPWLGRPLAHVTAAVLDADGAPVLAGAPGHLWIAGPSLARGYDRAPGRTAAAFRPDPDGPPGSRRYDTGDRVRETATGQFLFLGRSDRQLKLRGHRLDPADVEAVLARHPAVAAAVVLPHHDTLAAYLVPSGAQKPPLQAVRRFLEDDLPPHLIPSHFIWIADPPLTASGKIDAARLPDPSAPAEGGAVCLAPETELERVLAGVWASVLAREPIGVLDNFFLSGGDSIASIQVVARASQLGLHVTPKQLFDHPTIRELATVVQTIETRTATPPVSPGQVPLTPIQHWFFDGQLPEPHHYNHAVWLDAREPLDLPALRDALQAVIDHHDALRLRFVPAVDGWRQLQGIERETIPLEVVELAAGASPAELTAHARRAQSSLNLVKGPLVRAVLFRAPDRSDRLLLIAHHLVVDGMSWTFLLEDLQRAYLFVRRGAPVQLAPKTAAFQAWADHLLARARALDGATASRQEWLHATVLGVEPTTPACGVRGNAEIVQQRLDAGDVDALFEVTRTAYGLQPQEALLAALVEAYRGWSGQPAPVIEVEAHGRASEPAAPDVSRTVGWFTVRYPLRLQQVDADPGAALKSVKEAMRRLGGRSGEFGLFRYLARDAAFQDLPSPSISFNYFGQVTRHFPDGSPFAAFSEEHETSRAASSPRRARLDVSMALENGRLHVSWEFDRTVDSREAVARLSGLFADAVARITAHCRQPDAGAFTPSDFPAASLSQHDLDHLLSEWSREFS